MEGVNNISDNIRILMAKASCFGHCFNVKNVHMISPKESIDVIRQNLHAACNARLINLVDVCLILDRTKSCRMRFLSSFTIEFKKQYTSCSLKKKNVPTICRLLDHMSRMEKI